MSREAGGPAFPLFAATGYSGMTLRDYFAAKAMQALVPGNYFNLTAKQAYEINITAKQAYEMADAMLKAREQ